MHRRDLSELHRLIVSTPHHVFVSDNFTVVGAE
jgi:hypothetical protein